MSAWLKWSLEAFFRQSFQKNEQDYQLRLISFFKTIVASSEGKLAHLQPDDSPKEQMVAA
jgi:hypothetical protein